MTFLAVQVANTISKMSVIIWSSFELDNIHNEEQFHYAPPINLICLPIYITKCKISLLRHPCRKGHQKCDKGKKLHAFSIKHETSYPQLPFC